jgi:hypothetical protein
VKRKGGFGSCGNNGGSDDGVVDSWPSIGNVEREDENVGEWKFIYKYN